MDAPTGYEHAPSLAFHLDQYKINANSFQREMEAFAGVPSPGLKDMTWQQNASQLLESPNNSPRRNHSITEPHPPNGQATYYSAVGDPALAPMTIVYTRPFQQVHQGWVAHGDVLQPTFGDAGGGEVYGAADGDSIGASQVTGAWGYNQLAAHSSRSCLVEGTLHTAMVGHVTHVTHVPDDPLLQQSHDGVCAITSRLGSSTLDSRAHLGGEAVAYSGGAPATSSHVMTPVLATTPASCGGATSPISVQNLQQFQKRQRSVRAQLTFEAYENQYGPSAKCESGPCADHCITPCKAHTCKCCKKYRKLETAGSARAKGGYCGKCQRREKVEGLEFVKCNHTACADGATITCAVEMLRDVFDNHWKQHKNEPHDEALPTFLEVNTDVGRKCGACTNMRPITYYPDKDTNCSCSHCQVVKSKGSSVSARKVNSHQAIATPSSTNVTTATALPQTAGTGVMQRTSCTSAVTAAPRPTPSVSGLTGSGENITQSENASPPCSSIKLQMSSALQTITTEPLVSPGTEQLMNLAVITGSRDDSGTSRHASSKDDLESAVQQAEVMLSNALASLLCIRPTLEMLSTRLRQPPHADESVGSASAASAPASVVNDNRGFWAALHRLQHTGQQIDKEVQQLLTQSNDLTATRSAP